MSNTLISKENLESILIGFKNGVITKINSKDITIDQKVILSKADKIITTGDGSSFLSNDGTYKPIDIVSMNDIHDKTQNVMNLFDIKYSDTTYAETINAIMPIKTFAFGCVEYNGKIYCIGGYNTDYTDKVQIYDINSNTWTTGANMPTPRAYLKSILYNGKIYCIGGTLAYTVNTLEVYDILNNSWSTEPAIPGFRYAFGCVEYNDKIYLIGGSDDSSSKNTVYVYDLINKIWSTGTVNIPTAISNFGCVQYNGKIYCIGGYNGAYLNTVNIYDIASNTWSTGNNMPTARYGFGCVEYNGNIYCIAGRNSGIQSIVEIYDINSNTWTIGINIITSKYQFGYIIYKNNIYCIAGETSVGAINSIDVLHLAHTDYTLNLPTDLQAKLSLIPDTGDGTLILADNGTYISVPLGYRFMTDTEVSSAISTLNSYNV